MPEAGRSSYPHAVGVRRLVAAPGARDWGLAALFAVPSLGQVLLEPIAPRPVGVAVALASTLPLAWRRAAPVVAAAVGVGAWLPPTPDGFLYLGFIVACVLFYAVGVQTRSLLATGGVMLWALGVGTWSVLRSDQPLWTVGSVALVVVVPVCTGRLAAHERRQITQLRELMRRLAHERELAEKGAVAMERERIARELHDVVGHDVTVMALQADAAAAALAVEPLRAAAPIQAIRTTSRRTLSEMRQVLGRLRDVDDGGDASPPWGGTGVAALVEEARAMGERVEMTVSGEPASDPTTTAAVFRILQESLTNARRHSPGAAVHVDLDWDGVDLRVSNRCPEPSTDDGDGLGLVGMSERARLAGGLLTAGHEDGSFVVRAHLPRATR